MPQVRGSLNMGTAEAEQCAICMEHEMEAAIWDCAHEVCLIGLVSMSASHWLIRHLSVDLAFCS